MKNFPLTSLPDESRPGKYTGGKLFVFALIGMFVISACAPRTGEMLERAEFEPSDETISEVIALLPFNAASYTGLEGRARAQVSGPDYSELATVEFTSDRTQSLMAIRNNLGIEGGRIYADRDSVTIYDRIERMAWKMDLSNARSALLSGFTAFNILDFLIPDIHPDEVDELLESDESWLVVMHDGKQIFIDKEQHYITRIFLPADDPEAFNQFKFESHARISGIRLPRRIQILSNDEKSNIFLTIRSLEVNPASMSFDIQIPDDVPIEYR